MLVRFWMVKSPKTASVEMNLEEALDTMHQHSIRRLPVVKGDKLRGIIALSDLYPYVGPHALNRAALPEEAAAKLRSLRVSEVMSSPPVTCDLNAPLEEVGTLMRRRKIGALPVVHGDELVGIITESDVLAALANIAQMGTDGRRICFRMPVEEKIDIFYRIVSLCQKYGLEILTLLTHALSDGNHLVMLRVRGQKVPEFIETLWKSHYEVIASTPK
jgi:acetoin utilization protein AcuB